jgi:LmbE family N-acetylglucosaminyl deacetylase
MLDLAVAVEQQIAQSRPSLILTHNANDLNVDHRQVHEAVMTAARPQPGHQSPDVLCFEVPSSTEWRSPTAGNAFVPQVFVDISEYLDSKIEALRFYADELRPWPHARSIRGIEHLAGWRGASCGVEAAEAFMVARARW